MSQLIQKKGLVAFKRNYLHRNLFFQRIAIVAGIRIWDVGQLNILVPFVATLLCILHDVARN